MREIKFRAWHKEKKEMFMVKTLDLDHWGVGLDKFTWVSNDEVELMQFTGLQDKDGKNIYEGDIVKVFAKDLGTADICEMKWIDHGFSPTDKNGKHYGLFFPLSTYELEIVGNIYRDPHLLKEEHE